MKNQWTTVFDNTQSVPAEQKTLSTGKSAKNRKVALALASMGVFLIIIGAAPFFFDKNDSSDYSAFLQLDSPQNQDPTVYVPAVDVNFEDGDEITLVEPVEVDIDEVSVEENVEIPLPDVELEEVPDWESEEVVDEEETPDFINEVFPEPAVILDDESAVINQGVGIITETQDFPINTHTGKTVDPIVLAAAATSEQLRGVAMEKNPETGLPLFPILIFSGAAALLARRKVLNKKLGKN